MPLTPSGTFLEDGFPTKIAFSSNDNAALWEKTVTPPGYDGGDKINVTTMHNAAWRTFAARALKELTDSAFSAAYDPKAYNDLMSVINVEQTLTVHFPDGSTLAFYGYLKSFLPDEVSEGEQPTATVEIVATNRNPSTGAEAGPTYTASTGT